MSPRDDISVLLRLTDAVYQNDRSKLQSLVAQENAVRLRLTELDATIRSAQAVLSETQNLQRVGADLRWQAWCAQKREQLNAELARIRALKLPVQETVAKSFGRKTALSDIQKSAQKRKQLTKQGLR